VDGARQGCRLLGVGFWQQALADVILYIIDELRA